MRFYETSKFQSIFFYIYQQIIALDFTDVLSKEHKQQKKTHITLKKLVSSPDF
jgi:hypothetical protein